MSASPQEDEREEIVETPSQGHKDAMENSSLMVRWSHDTRAMYVMDFIRQEQLFGRLNAFLRSKIK